MAFSVFVDADARYDSVRNRYIRANSADGVFGYTVNGAITIAQGIHRISKTSAAAMTLAQPTASDEGCVLGLEAGTAFAHTVTVAGGLGGNAADDVLTFAKVGDGIRLRAMNLRWVPEGAPYGVVIS
jgi:hypothetical protein